MSEDQSVAEAAESGDQLALLVAMRDRIARTVADPKCPPRDLASLTRRLQDIAREIESIRAARANAAPGTAEVAEDERFDPSAL